MKTLQQLTHKYADLMHQASICSQRKEAIRLIRKSTEVKQQINELYAAR